MSYHNASVQVEKAVKKLQAHQAERCNWCFQGIFCHIKHRLQVSVVEAKKQLREAAAIREQEAE